MVAAVILGVVIGFGLYYAEAKCLEIYITRRYNAMVNESMDTNPDGQPTTFTSPRGH